MISFNLHQVNFDTSNNTVFKTGDNKYVGKFYISKNGTQNVKFQFSNGKHYIKEVLIYEGDFQNFKYHGSGMKYHTNGCIMATGLFEEGEPYRAEYYDESGSLIYSDDGSDISYTVMPGLINDNGLNLIQNNKLL